MFWPIGLLVAIGILALGIPLAWRLWESYRVRRRETVEDALKVLWDCVERQTPSTPDVLAGRLRLSLRAAVRLVQHMSEHGLVRMEGSQVRLTPAGRALALHVLRAHRLWERYLSDNTAVPLTDIHRMADKAEHRLTPAEVQRLDAHMGYPRRDPHGDPIPREGEEHVARIGTPLTDWPLGQPARIVHIEDEPEAMFAQILAEGLTPGTDVVIEERSPEGIHLKVEGNDVWLAAVLAAHIHVMPAPQEKRTALSAMTLADVPAGTPVRVVGLSSQVKGLLRRRLLDLGFTRGAVVEPVLQSAFGRGDPTAYRVRGTVVALRREQARHIYVEPITAPNGGENNEPADQTARANHAPA